MTNCHGLKMTAADGKKRLTDVADTEQLLRIIQSYPRRRRAVQALAGAGRREHIEETIGPEQAIDRVLKTYLKRGYIYLTGDTHGWED